MYTNKDTIKRFAVGVTLLASIEAHAASVLFSESFDDNSNGWSTAGGWSMSDGIYKFRSGSDFFSRRDSFIPFGGITTSDFSSGSYTISYDMRFVEPWVGFNSGLSWRDGNHLHVNWSSSSKEYSNVAFHDFPHGIAIGDTTSYSSPYTFSENQWYHYDINIQNNYLTLFLDGALVLEGDAGGSWGNGEVGLVDMDSLGFSVWRTNADFDNLVVSAVPIPAGAWLFGSAAVALFAGLKRKRL